MRFEVSVENAFGMKIGDSRNDGFDDILGKRGKYLGLGFGDGFMDFFVAELSVFVEVEVYVFENQFQSGV